ncbi:putative NRPS-like protein biosynthetic cluster [Claviceps sp. LM454 group G7]|nr:putative NRPS-like protein biosynthetic cluster [Claviceps sp. LM454 group G7]
MSSIISRLFSPSGFRQLGLDQTFSLQFVPPAVDGFLSPCSASSKHAARSAPSRLDLSHPLDRLKNICDALKSTITITTPTDSEIARELASTVIVIGEDALVESDRATPMYNRPKPTNGHPRSALYSVFTSGSSRKPKGVVIEHSSFVSSALASIQPLDIRPHDRLLHFSAYAFDISVFEVLTPLISGATIAVPS